MKRQVLWLAAAISLATSLNAVGDDDGLVQMSTPFLDIDESGIASIVGDVLADYAISSVELLVDGQFKANIPVQDGEVADINGIGDLLGPAYNDFSGAAYLGLLQPGMHEVTVRITDAQGNVQEVTTPVDIPNYFADSATDGTDDADANGVDLSGAQLSADGETLQIDNLQVNGNAFNMTLDWNADSGKFEVSSALPLALFLSDPQSAAPADDAADDVDDADDDMSDIDDDDFLSDAWFQQFVDPEDRWVFE